MNHDIQIRVEGALLERLTQQAIENGAVFTRIYRTGPRGIIVDTNARSADILISLCQRYGYNCRTLRRGGKTALLEQALRRWTILPTMALGAVLCMLFLCRIWVIDISFTGSNAEVGNREIIFNCIDEIGLETGIPAWKIDSSLLQKQLSARMKSYSFIGVQRRGIYLIIEASPEVRAPELYTIDQAGDLVAKRNGVVESITVYSGQACVKSGDTVLAGEVLIRGSEARTKEETTPVRARGEVIARCWYEGSAQAPLSSTENQRTGNCRESVRLSLFGLSLPLLECESFLQQETESTYSPVVGLFLPLQIERSHHWETTKEIQNVDPAMLENQLTTLARADALNKMIQIKDAQQIVSSWTDTTQNKDTLQVRAVYEIYADIAIQRDATIEEVY